MHVLVLQSELGVLRGGGENFTRNLFAAYARRGHRVTAAFVAGRNGAYPIPLPPGLQPVPLSGLWSMTCGQPTMARVGRFLAADSARRRLWDRVQEALAWRTIRWHYGRFRKRVELEFAGRWRNFDAVYVHSDSLLAAAVAKCRPTVLRLPGPVTFELAPVLRQVHAVCANGDALVRIRRFLGDHATELPLGIDTQRFTPGPTAIRSTLGWTDRNQVIGYVGRLVHVKGVDLLATAFRRISSDAPDARLLIVGSGPEETHIRPLLAQELSRGLVHIQPDVGHDALPEWYRAMDLMVMPSRYENLSNSAVEAIACGVPFLGSDIGGNRMLVEAGAGWLFEPDSATSLTARLREILGTGTEIKKCGRAGLESVRDRYSWDATAERLEWIMSTRLGVAG